MIAGRASSPRPKVTSSREFALLAGSPRMVSVIFTRKAMPPRRQPQPPASARRGTRPPACHPACVQHIPFAHAPTQSCAPALRQAVYCSLLLAEHHELAVVEKSSKCRFELIEQAMAPGDAAQDALRRWSATGGHGAQQPGAKGIGAAAHSLNLASRSRAQATNSASHMSDS